MPPFNRPPFGPMRPGSFPGGPALFNGRSLFGGGGPMTGAGPRGLGMGTSGGASRGGGLLSSLFGRGNGAASAVSGAANAASGGSTIGSFMNNTQKVLAAGEKIVPIVRQAQQYGPLIKNLPAMWKIYRGMNSDDSTTDEAVAETEESTTPSDSSIEEESPLQSETQPSQDLDSDYDDHTLREQSRASRPKLFI